MPRALIACNGIQEPVEVLSALFGDDGRSTVQARSETAPPRGHSCSLLHNEREAQCIVAGCLAQGDVFMLELRCLGDASFLMEKPLRH